MTLRAIIGGGNFFRRVVLLASGGNTIRATLFILIAIALLAPAAQAADPVYTPIGVAAVAHNGYLFYADGSASNPDPADGYVSVSASGSVCADDNGRPDDGNPANDPDSTSPTCGP